jgi:hypothetical protein
MKTLLAAFLACLIATTALAQPRFSVHARELARLIHGAPSEIGCTILTGKVDRISGMSSPPPSVLLGG